MNDSTTAYSPDQHATAEADPLQGAIQFLAAVRRRKWHVIGALALTLLSGAAYYKLAPRIFEASASMLVTQTGADVSNTSLTDQKSVEALPTYERLFTSDVVLEGALAQLLEMDAGVRVDFSKLPEEKWIPHLRESLSVRSVRRTNLIEISYRSHSQSAAEAIVGAIVNSYTGFIEQHHKDLSVEIVMLLRQDRREAETRLLEKQQQLLDVQGRVGNLGMSDEKLVEHPTIQRLVKLSSALQLIQEQRLKQQAALAAIRAAPREGTDLRQRLIAIEPIVGRDLILGALGLDPQGIEGVTTVVRQLLENRIRLEALLTRQDPQASEVLELRRAIELAELQLADSQRNAAAPLDGTSKTPLSTALASMVEERLAATKTFEDGLLRQYAEFEAEAIKLHNHVAELELVKDEVSRLQKTHDSLLNRIESIDMQQGQASIRVAMVLKPTASDTPVSPRLSMVATLCLMFGLGSGLLIVYGLDRRDARVRSPSDPTEHIRTEMPTVFEAGKAA